MLTTLRITPTDLRDWGACYTNWRIRELYAGRRALTLQEILELNIPMADRLWVAAAALPAAVGYEIGCRIVELGLPLFEVECPDDRSIHDALACCRAEQRGTVPIDNEARQYRVLQERAWTVGRFVPPLVVDAAMSAVRPHLDGRARLPPVYYDIRTAVLYGVSSCAEPDRYRAFDASVCQVVLDCLSCEEL